MKRRTMLVAIDGYPSEADYDWKNEGTGEVNVTIARNHPKYCEKCNYFITVVMEAFSETVTPTASLRYICPTDTCSTCQTGQDPAKKCRDCLSGFFGATCTACGNCHNGHCDDGFTGTGECICDTGFSSYSNCTECLKNYWGSHCDSCESCNGHGDCQDGRTSDGSCRCNDGYDPTNRCSDCMSGRWGSSCDHVCPGDGVCSDRGEVRRRLRTRCVR